MNNFFKLSAEQRKLVIEQTSAKVNDLFPQIIEKDLWVTTILQLIFSLPFAGELVFRGGTSLSKVWNVIERFSEDIDLAVDRELFDLGGDLTIRQIKKLRKQSSLFVKDFFCDELQKVVEKYDLQNLCSIEPQPNGEEDQTYPEPRKIFIRYQSLFDALPYIKSEIVLEIGARSLIESTAKSEVKSMVSQNLPIETSLVNSQVITAIPEQTFIEKAFLLHEIFTCGGQMLANRKSRHLYDLEIMMDKDFAIKAISDNELWNKIRHHREKFTHVNGVDYSQDIRQNICSVPPEQVIDDWKQDYEAMQNTMIFGNSLTFSELIKRIKQLETGIRQTITRTADVSALSR
ncbi:MAG: nucleotidyl transferase AbiEii/AbiGii toxin family protein [Tannerella sp.]|jgi:hypothetical protein|nr:nucleotidyl transferase AbiEii/AbiGii toxin family protein [Tannerella sp.]